MAFTDPLLPFAENGARRVRFVLEPAPPALLPTVPRLLAGAAEVDITPPPGMPKAGHSRNAHTGTGFRTRLRAHVLHLRCGTASLALVQCDLLAGAATLQHLVAQAVADTDVPLAGLFVGATHTHAGPGQFHGNALMNRFASNRAGFDPAWTSWLVDRIATAVRTAVATRRTARLAFGATEVWGLTRNRSLSAHERNADLAAGPAGRQRKYAAINPWLHLLRVDAEAPDGGTEPLAATVIFSIHGTGISQRDRSYNADVWAYLKGELGRHVERSTGGRAVVGAVEGTHGDVAPAVRPGALVYPEAERVGRGIGAAAAGLYDRLEADLTSEPALAAGFRELDLATRPVAGGVRLPAPAFGAATIAGAYENVTPVVHRLPPFRPDLPKPGARGPHGAKWIPGGRRLHDLVVSPSSFPSVLPLQLLRIGPTLVAGLPFEVTVASGRRVEDAVRDAIGPGAGVDRVAVSSLANEQFCYLTTPEEYSVQRYEGGNTLYGPQSQPFVAACVAALARDLLRAGTVSEPLPRRVFDLPARRYLAAAGGKDVAVATLAAPEFTDPTGTEDGYWEFRWRGPAPGALRWHEPLARVEVATADGGWAPAQADGVPLDDQGYHVGVVHLGPERGRPGHRYAVRWYTPYLGPAPTHRLVVLAAAEPLPSPPFT